MIALIPIGLDLALIRSWYVATAQVLWDQDDRAVIGHDFEPSRCLGELGPMVSPALIGLAVAIAGRGRWRRLGLGVALSGPSLAVLIFLAPRSVSPQRHRGCGRHPDLQQPALAEIVPPKQQSIPAAIFPGFGQKIPVWRPCLRTSVRLPHDG